MSTLTMNKTIVFFDRLMAFSFYAFIFFLPISNALVETFTVLALLGYMVKRFLIFVVAMRIPGQKAKSAGEIVRSFFSSYALPANPLNRPIAAWLSVCLLSIAISAYPHLSFKAFLGKTLQSAFLFFNFLEAIRSRKRVMIYLAVYGVSCFFVCLSGLNQYIFKMDFIRMNVMEHARVNSTFRAPNDLAAYLVLTIPILASALFSYKRLLAVKAGGIVVVLLGSTFCLAVFSLMVSYSRGAIVALAAGFIFFGIYNLKDLLKIAFIGILLTPTFLYKLVTERELMTMTRLFHGFGRSDYWKEALNMIHAKPILGFGLNTYSMAAKDFKIVWGGYPHNCYLQMTAELGLVGLASFLWIVASLYRTFIKAFKLLTDPWRKSLALGVMTGLTGFFVHVGFDTFLYSVQLGSLFWVQMALGLALLNEDGALLRPAKAS